MKHNLCVKISYKKYLLANTSFPPPVVLQYTSGRSEEPAARMRDCNLHTGYLFLKPCKGRKSLQPECGIATAMKRLHPFKRYWRSEEPAARMRDCNMYTRLMVPSSSSGRKSLQPECGIATTSLRTIHTTTKYSRKSLQPECGIATTKLQAFQGRNCSRKSLQPECGIATPLIQR